MWECGFRILCVDILYDVYRLMFRQAAEQARGRAEHEPSQPRGPREEDPHQADERGEEQPGGRQQHQGQVMIVSQVTFVN